MADLEKLAEELSNLTIIEAADLSKMLEEKWGVSAAAPVAAVAVAGGDAGGAAAEEKTDFEVVLAASGDKKNQRYQGSSGNHRPRTKRGERSCGKCS